MKPMTRRRLDLMLERGHTGAVRKALLNMPHDTEAQTMLSDMRVAYPVSSLEKADALSRTILYYLLLLVAILIIGFASVLIVQLIVARMTA